jgi:hypothetical protein
MKFYLPTILAVLSVLFMACGSTDTKTRSEELPAYDGKKISIEEAVKKGFATLSANGKGTFSQIDVVIDNKTDQTLNLQVGGGLFFSNPNSNAQSLLTIQAIGEISIDPKGRKVLENIPTVCTNAQLEIPGTQTNWPSQINPDGTIDNILSVYSKYKDNINGYLQRKNPEKFQTEADQQRFLQVLVWAYSGAEYKRILDMLAKDVYGNDIDRAKQWLDGVYEDAANMANYIKNGDFKGLVDYLGLKEKIEKVRENANELKEKAGERLKNIFN